MLQHLIAINEYYDLNYGIYYWRTKHGLEIDFILYGPKGFIAIEVKNSTKIHSKDLTALKQFKEDYKVVEQYCIYRGNRKLYIDEINVIPADEAFLKLKKIIKG